MRAVARKDFLPADQQDDAAKDSPLPIGNGQTNSQPTTVLNMLVLLEVAAGMRVLDVGAGSAWTTALLGHLVGPDGHVIGVELDASIASRGAANLDRRDIPWARVELSRPGVLGWPDEAPYDRVLVSADAPELPQPLVDQVGTAGIMVAPVASTMLRVRRCDTGELEVTEHGRYAFVPLR